MRRANANKFSHTSYSSFARTTGEIFPAEVLVAIFLTLDIFLELYHQFCSLHLKFDQLATGIFFDICRVKSAQSSVKHPMSFASNIFWNELHNPESGFEVKRLFLRN